MPFSNANREGFENQIGQLFAQASGRPLHFVDVPLRRAFLRNTLRANLCDCLIGVPSNALPQWTTQPYYRSHHVAVRRASFPTFAELDTAKPKRQARIGIHLAGDDYALTPAALALAARGWASHLVGYPVYGNYSQPHPAAHIFNDVQNGVIDFAIVWGPQGAYYAHKANPKLAVERFSATSFGEWDISMAVRPGDSQLLRELNSFIEQRRSDISKILDRFHLPRTGEAL